MVSVASNQATVTGFGATFWPENHDDQPILADTLQVGNLRKTFGFFSFRNLMKCGQWSQAKNVSVGLSNK